MSFLQSGGSVIEVDPLDPEDDALVAAAHAVTLVAGQAEFGERHTVATLDELRSRRAGDTSVRYQSLAATTVAGTVVGAAELRLPLLDNPQLALAELQVHPLHRRSGIGSALLARLEELAAEAGRTTLAVEGGRSLVHPDAQGPFARRHGYAHALTSLRSDLELPGGAGDLDRVLAPADREVAAAGGDRYRLLTWWDGVPDEWLDQAAALRGRMTTDAPLGDLALEPEAWDAARLAQQLALHRSRGRRFVTTAALHEATGTLAAFTELGVALGDPGIAHTWNTLVLPEHRGARLGMQIKAANLRALLAELPGVRRVVTWNAEQNAPMLRVNRAIGFATVGAFVEWQKRL